MNSSLFFFRKIYLQKIKAATVAIIFLSLLLSCQAKDSPQALFDNYLYRLANSLDVDPMVETTTSLGELMSYPTRRQLQQAVPPLSINLVEFLRLSQCELQRHIGQKNSGLGRVMEPTQQYLYDIYFIHLAKECLNVMDATSALTEVLKQALQHKLRYLPISMWNASVASNEFSTLFSLGSQPLSFAELSSGALQLEQSLQSLVGIYSGGYRIIDQNNGGIELETHYQVIESSKYMGRLRLSWREVIRGLSLADQLLQQRITTARPLCFQQQPNAQYRIVDNVFHKFYIGEIQTYIAKLHQQSQRLLLLFDQLLSLQITTKTSTEQPQQLQKIMMEQFWQRVYLDEKSEWQLFQAAVQQHTKSWQLLLQQCGKLPN